MDAIKNRIASFLVKLGVSADFLTWLGLYFAASAGYLSYKGRFRIAALALLISGLLDLLDGAVARAAGTDSGFGGILDSSLDRYGDGFVLGGILFYMALAGHTFAAVLAFSALLGSFAVSYVRARAECAIDSCRVGFWERGERIGYLFLGLYFQNLMVPLVVLAVGTHGSALQRLWLSSRRVRGVETPTPALLTPVRRSSPSYLAQIVVLFLLVALCRIPLR